MFPAGCFRQRTYMVQGLVNGVNNETYKSMSMKVYSIFLKEIYKSCICIYICLQIIHTSIYIYIYICVCVCEICKRIVSCKPYF